MLRAAQPASRLQAVAEVKSMPAPVGGWNARDPLSDMNAKDAVILDNFFPSSNDVRLRKGSLRYAWNVGKISQFTRASIGTYFDEFDTLRTAAADVPRYGQARPYNYTNPPPLLVEGAATNYTLHSRDLSQAAWVKSSATAVRDQKGLDGAILASRIDATAPNGKVAQAITCPANSYFTAYVRRIAGAGAVYVTTDNGATLNPVATINSALWTKIQLISAAANPTIGFVLANTGDAIAVDLVQCETGAATSYIPTGAATASRAADAPVYLGPATASTNFYGVETLIEYSYGQQRTLLAAAGGGIYDITQGGSAGVPVAFGFINSRWQYINQAGYALMFNGADVPQGYNGTTIAPLGITGIASPQNLVYPCPYSGRVFAIEKNTLSVWYGGIGAIQGAFTKYDFSSIFRLGGRLVAMGTWSRDGGSGPNDYIVFITNMGEVLVYSGDPALVATWNKVGLYRCAPPIGGRPLVKLAQDLVIMTASGFLPLSTVLPIDRVGDEKYAISDKIRNAVSQANLNYGLNFGWEALLYPNGNMCLFNIPVKDGAASHQYVINVITGAWCRFTGLSAITWALSNEKAYFGAPGGFVVLFDTGAADDALTAYTGTNILTNLLWDLKTAFNYFGRKSQEKNFKMIRPVIGASGKPIVNIALNMDFEEKVPTTALTIGGGGSQWDVAMWDVAQWDSGIQIRKGWINAPGTGYCAAMRMRGSTNGLDVVLYSIDYTYERGGIL